MTESPGVYELDRIEKLAGDLGIPTMNLLEPLQEAGLSSKELYLLPFDGHPSKVAYSIVGNALFNNLHDKVRGLLAKGDTNGKSR